MSKRGRPPSNVTGRFTTREELIAALLVTREAGMKPGEVLDHLGITRSQYENIVRQRTKDRTIPKFSRRGDVVVRHLGHVEVFSPEEVAGLLDYLSLLRLPEGVDAMVGRLRKLTEVLDTRTRKISE